jgi:ABC-type transporter Mla MlaB component
VVPASARAEVVLLRDGAEVASWPLLCGEPIDLSVVDHLAHVQLEARRTGCSICLRHACPDLVELLELVGLGDVILRVGEKPDHLPGP